MESSIQNPGNQNTTLMATGASIAELPLEEEYSTKSKDVTPSSVEEDVRKIMKDIESSGFHL